MPVKVRCKECQKVLKAPDKARGKAIKCPECGARVRVPSGEKKSSSKRPTKKRRPKKVKEQETDGLGFLTGLDLGDSQRIEHKHIAICPKCAVEVDEEDEVCENCGVIIATGKLSDKEVRRRERRGPDPAEFYPVAWSDPWQFTLAHSKLVMKTIGVWTFFGMFVFVCLRMVFYCDSLPPALFWMGLLGVSVLGILGWFFTLQMEIIRLTLAKKKVLKKVAFDPFTAISLGLKFFIWPIVLIIPGISSFVYPIAMTHLAMPYTYKAFLPVTMIKLYYKNFGASLYWRLITTVIGIFNFIILVVGLLYSGFLLRQILIFIAYIVGFMVEINPDDPSFMVTLLSAGMHIIVWAVTAFVIALLTAPSAIYIMRLTGLYGYYNQEKLELVRFQAVNIKAPFGARYIAHLVDVLITLLFTAIVFSFFAGAIYMANYIFGNFTPPDGQDSLTWAQVYPKYISIASTSGGLTSLLFGGFLWKYFVGGETGPSQATLGKHAMGLIVTDHKGKRLKPKQAWKRLFFRRILGWFTLGISYATAAFNEEQETMHDKMTQTQVLWKGDDDRS